MSTAPRLQNIFVQIHAPLPLSAFIYYQGKLILHCLSANILEVFIPMTGFFWWVSVILFVLVYLTFCKDVISPPTSKYIITHLQCGKFEKQTYREKNHPEFHLSNIITENNLVNIFIDILSLQIFTKMPLHLAYCFITCFYHIKHYEQFATSVSFFPCNVILTSCTILYHMDISLCI